MFHPAMQLLIDANLPPSHRAFDYQDQIGQSLHSQMATCSIVRTYLDCRQPVECHDDLNGIA